MDVLEQITEVQRLTLRPGDSLVVRMRGPVNPDLADMVKVRIRIALGLDDSTRIVMLPDDMRIEVLAGAPGKE